MDYKKDYYSILEVEKSATPEALRAAYRRLAKLYHPDKNPGNAEAEERFKIINEAYEILSNETDRHIYDSYRAGTKETGPAHEPAGTREPFKQNHTKTYNATREKKMYIRGSIVIKFQGTPDAVETGMQQKEQQFTIIPTEVLVTILFSDIYREGISQEYGKAYAKAMVFTTPLKQPVNCRIINGKMEEYYQLDIYDPRINNPVFEGITRHEDDSFGTLHGEIFGHILHQYEEEVTEVLTACYGATGRVETKSEAGGVFTREQHYAADCSTYWTAWKRTDHTKKYYTQSSNRNYTTAASHQENAGCAWWLVLLILIALQPKLLFLVLPLLGLWLLILLIDRVASSSFSKILPWLGHLLMGFLVLMLAIAIFKKPVNIINSIPKRRTDSVSSKTTVIKDYKGVADTFITHHLRWQDRDSSRYAIKLSVPVSATHSSGRAHQQMDEQVYALQGIGAVYNFMLATDNDYMAPVAASFDSLANARHLNKQQRASMIVSCIQSIPFALIVDKSCSDSYADDYISQYLAACNDDCCKGYTKFGVQSPVEFLQDLKGDCDTRALFLYDVLGKLGYRVALLTSTYYKHALIAVNLEGALLKEAVAVQINEKPYYIWETTSKQFGPGQLPDAISNLNYWNITLTQ